MGSTHATLFHGEILVQRELLAGWDKVSDSDRRIAAGVIRKSAKRLGVSPKSVLVQYREGDKKALEVVGMATYEMGMDSVRVADVLNIICRFAAILVLWV